MTKYIHVHLTHDAGINTRKSSGGVTTWGGANPKKVVPKAPGLKPVQDAFEEGKHPRSHGQFTKGGGSTGSKTTTPAKSSPKESSHPTHPLPDSEHGSAVYDHPDGESSQVQKRKDGSYHGSHESFDFHAPNAEAMRKKLKDMGARHVGWEHTRDAGTSEGAKKAAQTRKAHGGGLTHFPGTEGTHFSGKPLATQPKNAANEHAQAAAYHNQKAGFPRTNKEHGEAAALHQHARMMHESPNSMIRSKANAASEKAWAASKKAK